MYDNIWFPLHYNDLSYVTYGFIKEEIEYYIGNQQLILNDITNIKCKYCSMYYSFTNKPPYCCFGNTGKYYQKVINFIGDTVFCYCSKGCTFNILKDFVIVKKIKRYKESHQICRKSSTFRFRASPVTGTGKTSRHKMFRKFRTFQEKRMSLAYDIKFTRGKRRIKQLPDDYDDISISNLSKSWKQNTKCRKQWMKHLK